MLPSQFLLRCQGSSWHVVAYLHSTDLAAVLARRTGRRRQSRPQDGVPANGLGWRATDDEPPQR
ncbi:hypothetical protein ABZ467_37565 [Streptomyces sp. NPDC005727]|uniref:hypothetical protein n=1 Tax=Streptomyces sp. NPDC005727 TaxID=3157053 RepID=UPI0033FBA9D8